MYCKHCGREIDDNSSFCKYCGKPQDNRVSTPNGFIDFIYKKPILSLYILWVIINIVCLWNKTKTGEYYNLLYPKFFLEETNYYYYNDSNVFGLDNYQITDFIVYAILIPLVLYLGYQYFKKITSIKYRILWTLWFIFHIVMYKMSNLIIGEYFFPFTIAKEKYNYDYPMFAYDAYDLSELVFYTMIIPIAYWGYIYYRDKKKKNK